MDVAVVMITTEDRPWRKAVESAMAINGAFQHAFVLLDTISGDTETYCRTEGNITIFKIPHIRIMWKGETRTELAATRNLLAEMVALGPEWVFTLDSDEVVGCTGKWIGWNVPSTVDCGLVEVAVDGQTLWQPRLYNRRRCFYLFPIHNQLFAHGENGGTRTPVACGESVPLVVKTSYEGSCKNRAARSAPLIDMLKSSANPDCVYWGHFCEALLENWNPDCDLEKLQRCADQAMSVYSNTTLPFGNSFELVSSIHASAILRSPDARAKIEKVADKTLTGSSKEMREAYVEFVLQSLATTPVEMAGVPVRKDHG